MKKLLLAVVAAGFAANLSAIVNAARDTERIIIQNNDDTVEEYKVKKAMSKKKKERHIRLNEIE